jgi:hypothetical protein
MIEWLAEIYIAEKNENVMGLVPFLESIPREAAEGSHL